jgi:hypothetical protein
MPVTNNKMNRIINDGDAPSKLIVIAEIPGVKMTRYFIQILSASNPMKGLKRDGILLTTSSKPATDREMPNFAINKGSIGARKAV